MSVVSLQGVYMGHNVKTSEYDGNKKSAILIDVYQADSERDDKMLQVRTDDLELLNFLGKEYAMGSLFECRASVNAYKNKAYFKLLDLPTKKG